MTVEAVDRESGRGLRRLRFSPTVEALFLDEYLARRARMVPLWALLGTLFYLAAILGDRSLMTDVAPTLVALRLFAFAPYALLVVAVMRLWPSVAAFDWLALGTGVLGLALPMTMLVFSQSPHLFVYQTGSVATFAFFVIVLRPRFATILAGVSVMTAIQLATTGLNGHLDAVTYSAIATFYLTLVAFLVLSAYFAERLERLDFLGRLRSEALQAELLRQSQLDPMTGLYNRHMLLQTRDRLWAPGRAGEALAVIMLDIDHFKAYNDHYGHIEGDACIRRVADTVREQAGPHGIVFRYGGEEMLVLMPGATVEAALAMAGSIHAAIATLRLAHRGLGPDGRVSASIGVAAGRTDGMTAETLLRLADGALYEAKRAGRDRIHAAGPRVADG